MHFQYILPDHVSNAVPYQKKTQLNLPIHYIFSPDDYYTG